MGRSRSRSASSRSSSSSSSDDGAVRKARKEERKARKRDGESREERERKAERKAEKRAERKARKADKKLRKKRERERSRSRSRSQGRKRHREPERQHEGGAEREEEVPRGGALEPASSGAAAALARGPHSSQAQPSQPQQQPQQQPGGRAPEAGGGAGAASAAVSAAPAAADAAAALSAEEKKRQRLERLSQWQQQQAQQQQPAAPAKPAAPVAAPVAAPTLAKPLGLVVLAKGRRRGARMADDDEDQTVVDAPSSKPAMPAFFAALHEPPSVPAAPSQVAGDVDPLDAFMSGIRETKQDELRVAVAATMHASHSRRLQDDDDAPGSGAVAALLPGGAAASDAPSPAEELGEEAAAAGAAAVITFEEVLRLAKGGVGAGAGAVDRAKEEASHASFLQAFRAQNAEEERLLALAQEREAAEAAAAVDKDLFADAAEVGRGGVAAGELIHLEDDGGHEAVLAGERTGPSGLELLRERANKKELKAVDHSQIEYAAFRKELYVESPEVSEQSAEAVEAVCESLEIRVRGAKPFPAPVSAWVHCGLSSRVMEMISRAGWAAPFAIQRQALPIIMSGRDMIGVAKTGSGKTLAFVLPMFRHVMDQPPVRAGEGPVALLLAPARELAVQIHDVVCTFTKPLGLTTVCCYGGATVKDQIMQIRRGAAVLVATPGRLIDLLSAGRLLSLTRVTYVVLDEADRMFDMGFEPQVMRIINNTRPDRQIVLFSATFPPLVERVARDVLRCKPVVVVVGGRTKASSDIAQFVEVREPQDKFPRLLQLLGDWYEVGGVLVFVKSQDACDKLFMQLMQAGYRALTLHGGKDQADRDFAFQDFKAGRQTLMVATSVAGRGLDVAALRLVVNYDVPNHLEDYIHRIGRTGRAGNKGTAYTFISSEEDSYAPDLVKALKDANQSVPAELETLARRFQDKIEKGEAHFRSSGYRGHGFTFKEGETTELGKQQELLRKQQQASLGLGKPDEHKQEQDETDGDGIVAVSANTGKTTTVTPTAGASSSNSSSSSNNHSNGNKIAAAQAHPPPPEGQAAAAALAKVRSLAGKFAQPTSAGEHGHSSGRAGHKPVYFAKEVVINDYPKDVRIKISHVDTLNRIHELTACAAVPKGVFVPPGRRANAGERPMYILIEGSTEYDVARAANEVNRILEEATQDVAMREAKKGSAAPGRYSVV